MRCGLFENVASLTLAFTLATSSFAQGTAVPINSLQNQYNPLEKNHSICDRDKTIYDQITMNEKGVVESNGIDFFIELAGLQQYTIVGVPHTIEVLEFFAQEELIEGLAKKSGVDVFHMEIPQQHQADIDAYMEGSIVALVKERLAKKHIEVNAEGIKEWYRDNPNGQKTLGDTHMLGLFELVVSSGPFQYHKEDAANALLNRVKYSKTNGINISFYDIHPSTFKKYPRMAIIYDTYLTTLDTYGSESANRYLNSLSPADSNTYAVFIHALFKERDSQNVPIANNIIENTGERTVFVTIGGSHMIRCGASPEAWDLDEMLPDNSLVIQILMSLDDPTYKHFYQQGRQMPDFFFSLEEEKGFKPPDNFNSHILNQLDDQYVPTITAP